MLHIRKCFWTAGRSYNWTNDHQLPGVGINLLLLKNYSGNDTLFLLIGNDRKVYHISKQKALEIADSYKSFFQSGNTTLAVIPLDCFQIVGKEKQRMLI